jgi:hypothetical protein
MNRRPNFPDGRKREPTIASTTSRRAAVPPARPKQMARWCRGANWLTMSAATKATENAKPNWAPSAVQRRAVAKSVEADLCRESSAEISVMGMLVFSRFLDGGRAAVGELGLMSLEAFTNPTVAGLDVLA